MVSIRIPHLCLILLALSTSASAIDARVATDVSACEDFFEHVNRDWMKRTSIPAERARWGAFNQLALSNRQVLIEEMAKHEKLRLSDIDSPGKQKALMHYRAGLNLDAIEKANLAPIEPLLRAIDQLNVPGRIPTIMGLFARHAIAAPIAVSVQPDSKDKSRYLVNFSQGGLGLPDRDDYTKDDPESKRYRDAYASYRRALLGNDSDAVFALEKALAEVSMPRAQMRDPNRLVNYHTIESAESLTPDLSWRRFIAASEISTLGNSRAEFNIAQPEFMKGVAKLMRDVPLDVWRQYFRVRLLDAAAPYLHRQLRDAEFAYRTTVITGVATPLPRNELVIDLISGRVGSEPVAEGVGQFFVARAFSPTAKAKAVSMVEDIKAAFRERLQKLDWMDESTRTQAIAKLDAMALKIGYANQWKSYDGLDIREDDFAGNWLRARGWDYRQRVGRLGTPVDRTAWSASPHIVNAFAGTYNDIVFPAGILQPPFFDEKASDAQNFGAIGMVIGHEITHHFDDRGRRFDAKGNLSDWWTPRDAENYKRRAAQVIAQFDAFEPVPGTRVNGINTQGENISDLGGITIAYAGLQRALARAKVDGHAKRGALSPNQAFFVSFGQMWRELHRTESLINQLRTGSHSPGRYRVNGPLANFKPFADAFACKPGSGFIRPEGEMITIW